MSCFAVLKKHLRELVFPTGTTPVSIKYLLTLAFSAFAFSLVWTMPFAFLPSMIKSFGYSEKDVGYYAGIVAASFFGGQTLASYFCGWLCDRIGSKTSHMIISTLLMIMTIVFGMSENLKWAVGSRLSQGLLGTLLVTLKANAFSVCDVTNNSIAVTAIFGAFSIGMVAGPALGGYLVYPCEQFQALCSKRSLFGLYPFLLPNLVCSACLFISVIFSYFYIPRDRRLIPEETTLLRDRNKNTKELQIKEDERYTKSLSFYTIIMELSFTVISTKAPHNLYDTKDEKKQAGTVSYFYIEHSNSLPTKYPFRSCWRFMKRSSLYQLIKIKSMVISLSIFAISSLVNTGFEELYPVFADSSYRYGGLQFTASEIGRSLLLAAILLLFFIFTLPKLNQKIGEKMVVIWTLYVMLFCLPIFPLMSKLNKSNVWFVVVSSYCLVQYCIFANFFAANLLINNATPPQLTGAVNGLSMTVSCLFRTLGPATFGPLYTWSLGNEGKIGFPFDHCFPFVLLGFLCFLSIFLTIGLPKKFSERPKLNFDAEVQPNQSQSGLKDKPNKAMMSKYEDRPLDV